MAQKSKAHRSMRIAINTLEGIVYIAENRRRRRLHHCCHQWYRPGRQDRGDDVRDDDAHARPDDDVWNVGTWPTCRAGRERTFFHWDDYRRAGTGLVTAGSCCFS
jgi:hypothetical protein